MVSTAGPKFDMLLFQELPWQILRDEVGFLERTGLGTVWLADHYAFPPRPTAPVLEAWTTLGALAASTSRIRLGTMVSNVATRHPAILAKMASTVDVISSGRLDLGVGAGGGEGLYKREYDWLGIPPLRRAGRVRRLRESVEVIHGLLLDGRLTYQGEHYRLEDAPLVPTPVQRPRPPLFVAAQGQKSMLVAAEFADGWVSLGDAASESQDSALQALQTRNHKLDEYCQSVGRAPSSLERVYFAGWASGEVPFASAGAFSEFVGTYQEAGVQRFIFSFVSEEREVPPSMEGRYAGRRVLDDFVGAALRDMRGGVVRSS
jgi:alkanesulfonate monooxygenase SsuD/methylene tetrahydromethanopterin reductase-like flavin-dependent oxidoreductase (luciferase family)